MLSGSCDSTVRIWDAATGQLLGNPDRHPRRRMAGDDARGLLRRLAQGRRCLSIVRGLEVFSIDQFYQVLHRPDLVREKLAGDPDGKVRDAGAKLDLAKLLEESGPVPKVTIVSHKAVDKSSSDLVNVEARLDDDGGGIGKAVWRISSSQWGSGPPFLHDVVEMPGSTPQDRHFHWTAAAIPSSSSSTMARTSSAPCRPAPRCIGIALMPSHRAAAAVRPCHRRRRLLGRQAQAQLCGERRQRGGQKRCRRLARSATRRWCPRLCSTTAPLRRISSAWSTIWRRRCGRVEADSRRWPNASMPPKAAMPRNLTDGDRRKCAKERTRSRGSALRAGPWRGRSPS